MVKKISETFLLTSLPFIGYLCAYAFEYGYLSYFNIPINMIRIDFTTTITALIYLVIFLNSVYVMIEVLKPFFDKIPSTVLFKFIQYIFIYFLVLGISYLSEHDLVMAFYTASTFNVLLIIQDFILPIWRSYKYKVSLRETFESSRIQNLEYDSVMDKIVEKTGFNLYKYIGIAVILIITSSIIGKYNAQSKNSFLIDKENNIVIRIYNDMYIAKMYSEEKNIVKNSFIINQLVGEQPNKFIQKEIYPLKVTENNNTKIKS